MKVNILTGFTQSQRTIIIAISISDNIKSSYDIERNNRLLPPAWRQMEKNNLIIRNEEGYARLNKKKFEEKLGEGNLDKFIDEINRIPNKDLIKENPKLLVLKNSTIKDLFNKSDEITQYIKKKT